MEGEDPTIEDYTIGGADLEGLDIDEDKEEWELTQNSKPKSCRRKFYPVVAARKSTKTVPCRKSTNQANQIDAPDMSNSTSNSFTILNSCGDDTLEDIAINCDVSLGRNRGEIQDTVIMVGCDSICNKCEIPVVPLSVDVWQAVTRVISS